MRSHGRHGFTTAWPTTVDARSMGRRGASYLGLLSRLRVTAAFLAAADRLAAGLAAEAAPPILPPLCAAGWPVALPRPDPPSFLPPPSSLLTVARPSFGLLLRNATSLVAFRYVVGFALLLVRVLRFIAARHACLLRCGDHNQRLVKGSNGLGCLANKGSRRELSSGNRSYRGGAMRLCRDAMSGPFELQFEVIRMIAAYG